MPGTTLEINKIHWQLFKQPLVETCLHVDRGTQDKDSKTNKHMGCANTHVQLVTKTGIWRATGMDTDLWLTHAGSFFECSMPK